MDVIIAWCNQK